MPALIYFRRIGAGAAIWLSNVTGLCLTLAIECLSVSVLLMRSLPLENTVTVLLLEQGQMSGLMDTT